MVLCKMSTYNITTHHGECLQDCPHGAWNGPEGICGAECLECGGILFTVMVGLTNVKIN